MGHPFYPLEYAAIKERYHMINLINLTPFLVYHEMPIKV